MRAGDICTKAVAVVIEAVDLIYAVTSNSAVLSTKKKKQLSGTKVRSELRHTEISGVGDEQFIKVIRDRKSRWSGRRVGVCIPDVVSRVQGNWTKTT